MTEYFGDDRPIEQKRIISSRKVVLLLIKFQRGGEVVDNVMKVKIINYQRIKNASLEFIPGLNVIVGQTNNGKSSLIRALETAIYNISREGHVTLGETKSAVGIEYRGHQVIWRRDTEAASQVTYRVDGKIYGKLGRGQPDVVKEALGISEVEINEQKFRVNFSKQMSYPFLLNATPSELFKFIVQSSEEDNVVEVLNDMRSDVNEISANVKKYDEARNSLGTAYQREAQRFKDKKQFLPICNEVLELEGKVKQLKKLKETIESFEKCRYVVQKAEESITYIGKIQKYIQDTEVSLKEKIDKVSKITDNLNLFESSKKELEFIDNELQENSKSLEALKDVESYLELYKNMEPNQMKLNILKPRTAEYLSKSKEYKDVCEEIQTITENVEKQEKVYCAVGKALERVDKGREEVSTLKDSLVRYNSGKENLKKYKDEEESYRTELSEVEKEINSIGVCPYCGNEMKGESHEHN